MRRFFRRDRARYPEEQVHVDLVTAGRLGRLSGFVEHYTYRTLDDYFEKLGRYTSANALKLHRKRRRAGPLTLLLRPPCRFFRLYVLRGGVRDGTRGLVLAGLAALSVFAKYAKLWDLRRRGKRGEAPELDAETGEAAGIMEKRRAGPVREARACSGKAMLSKIVKGEYRA